MNFTNKQISIRFRDVEAEAGSGSFSVEAVVRKFQRFLFNNRREEWRKKGIGFAIFGEEQIGEA